MIVALGGVTLDAWGIDRPFAKEGMARMVRENALSDVPS
jgi:hypothetical protein